MMLHAQLVSARRELRRRIRETENQNVRAFLQTLVDQADEHLKNTRVMAEIDHMTQRYTRGRYQ